jgi:C_GCAxxG_C_C family probable redox protein
MIADARVLVLHPGPGPSPRTIMTKTEISIERFLSGYNCAQAVLFAFGPDLGLESETALRIATGLGGGMGRRGEVCGAVTGAILVLGLKFGRDSRQDRSATERTYQKTRDLMAAFERRHGSCTCRALLDGCDLLTPQGQQHFKENELQRKTCAQCVETAVELLEGLLESPTAPKPTVPARRASDR